MVSQSPGETDKTSPAAGPEQLGPCLKEAPQLSETWERVALYGFLAVSLLLVSGAMLRFVNHSEQTYTNTIDAARRLSEQPQLASTSLEYVFALSRAQDAAQMKAVALWLGFVVITFGCFFVLKGVEANYRLSFSKSTTRSALSTSSPGLVLITFGTVLVIAATIVKSTININDAPSAGGDASVPAAPVHNQTSTLPRGVFNGLK
jgi:hypothetical protein